ncbi:hypothetical protein BHF33_04025 [Escherichia coli]|uniref:DUF551 domain-containing protein n=3 Tax=Escherichia coli TaxID=562 RepID=UPI000854777A|nr:DUF551 domain-containing protein [Escherichia coli]EFO2430934.1 DUF551 domain-containing protein [Escherichia coli]OEM77771.1 hypothetical protein BHF33_04025 [Escherichia coli]HBA3220385.1 DUF551 domain-containing protein [Escherichia coli]HBC8052390.1 DUF551 domain-containing protein [Escherichia coli]
MTTFTDKELIKEIKERIGSLDVRDNIERRAYEIALASLEAEPVAWMRDDADGREYNARNEFSGGGGGVPLYATPPVPVVPEEKPMPNPLSMYAVDAVAAIAEVRGWNACRAAMLQGKSEQPQNAQQNIPENIPGGNSPVIPDGWISCSERMPAQDDWILIYSKHGEYMAGQVQGEYMELSDGTLSWLGNALFWMPLPESPQEAK